MSPDPTPDDPAPQATGFPATTKARIAIIVIGVALPYLARIPGAILYGSAWMTSYFANWPLDLLLIGGSNAINWGSILLVSIKFRSIRSIVVAAVVGFSLPAFGHATLNLAADALSAIAIPMFPIMALPLVGIGWLVGHLVDRKSERGHKSKGDIVLDSNL